MHKEPPGTMRQIERLIPRPALNGQQPTSTPPVSVNVSLGSNLTQKGTLKATPQRGTPKPGTSVRPRGRPSAANAATSPLTPKMPAAANANANANTNAKANNTLSASSSAVQVSRLQPNAATKTALTGELAQRIFEAMLPLIQSKAEPTSPVLPARAGRGRPPKHKSENDSATTLRKQAESIAMSLLNNNQSSSSSANSPTPPELKPNVSPKPAPNKPSTVKSNKASPLKSNKASLLKATSAGTASKRQANKHSSASDSSSVGKSDDKAFSLSEDDEEFAPVAKRRRCYIYCRFLRFSLFCQYNTV